MISSNFKYIQTEQNFGSGEALNHNTYHLWEIEIFLQIIQNISRFCKKNEQRRGKAMYKDLFYLSQVTQ